MENCSLKNRMKKTVDDRSEGQKLQGQQIAYRLHRFKKIA